MAANIYSDNSSDLQSYPMQMSIMSRLSYIIWLTNRRATGSPEVLAGKVGVRKTRLWELVNMIRKAGVDMEFDRVVGSYLFTNGKRYYLQFEIEELRIDKFGNHN